MAITNNNQKMAVIAFGLVALAPLYMTIDNDLVQADQQQLLWQYPGIAFAEYTVVDATASMGLSMGLGLGL